MPAPALGAVGKALARRALIGAAERQPPHGRKVGCGCLAIVVAGFPLMLAVVIASFVVGATPLGALGFDESAAEPRSGSSDPIECEGLGISQGYGDTPYEHPHTGIDLTCPAGTPVLAVVSGIFHRRAGSATLCAFPSGAYGGLGNYGEIDAGDVSYLYGHLEGFAIPDGVPVAAGTVIGFEGTSGCSTGFHLHFEVRVAGRVNNPCPFLPQGYPAAHDIGGDRCWGAAPP